MFSKREEETIKLAKDVAGERVNSQGLLGLHHLALNAAAVRRARRSGVSFDEVAPRGGGSKLTRKTSTRSSRSMREDAAERSRRVLGLLDEAASPSIPVLSSTSLLRKQRSFIDEASQVQSTYSDVQAFARRDSSGASSSGARTTPNKAIAAQHAGARAALVAKDPKVAAQLFLASLRRDRDADSGCPVSPASDGDDVIDAIITEVLSASEQRHEAQLSASETHQQRETHADVSTNVNLDDPVLTPSQHDAFMSGLSPVARQVDFSTRVDYSDFDVRTGSVQRVVSNFFHLRSL